MTEKLALCASCVLWVLTGCGGDSSQCKIGDSSTCDNGRVCESYTDGSGSHNACFAPTLLTGQVTNALSGGAIAGARVVAIDGDSHAATAPAATTDANGNYSVRILAPPRTAGGQQLFTLRVSAASYQDFPSGIRVALPITVAFADAKGAATVTGPEDVALLPIANAPAGSIAGAVTATNHAGVLVVAEDGSGAGRSGISDADGNYVIFNVPAGTYSVSGYLIGAQFASTAGVAVAQARVTVNLSQTGAASGVLTGSLTYVAGADTSRQTAVVLRLRATREVPPGFQAPAQNSMPYRLEGIPDGTFDVLAAFPNDQLVKDPDPGQAGTGTPTVTFAGGNTIDAGSFKVTDAVDMTQPDANQQVAGTPTFSWSEYPQTSHYLVQVFDGDGNTIWALDNIPRSTSLTYAGPALQPGLFYQWRITSFAQSAGTPRPISSSEDLRGVWQAK
jgi:hypothetical protein